MKKLIWIMGVALCVMAVALAGVTIAWFTDIKETTNVFTAGDVKISMTELNPEKEMINVTNHAVQMDYGYIYPGLKVEKNTTITNIGSEDAYLAAEIVILGHERGIENVLSIPGESTGKLAIDKFFEGGVWGETFTLVASTESYYVTYESDHYIVRYDKRHTDGFWIDVFVKEPLSSGQSLMMWNGFTFPDTWGNDEMLACANLRISVCMFAAQVSGFNSCTEAITTAFNGEFGFYE